MIDASILWDTKDNFAKLCNENEFATYNIFCGLQKPKRILFTMVIIVIKNWVMKDNLHFFAKLTLKNSTFFCKMRCSLDDPLFSTKSRVIWWNVGRVSTSNLDSFCRMFSRKKNLFKIVYTDIFDCNCTLFFLSGLCTSMVIFSWGHFLASISG